MGRVAGKVALVTGAARGQGRSHAIRLAQEGADIIAVDLCAPVPGVAYEAATPEDLAQTAKEVEALDRRILIRQADTRDRAALTEAIDAGVAEFGKLDIVVANAGICIIAEWDDVTPDVWRDTIDINLTGTWNTAQLAAPHLISNGGGSMILTSSVAGLKGLPFLTPYVASKHGITGLTRALAHELAEHHIRVNSLHPTGVNTPMGTGAGVAAFGDALAAHPSLGALFANSLPVPITEPIDQSNAVLFLASDESRYVTALALTVDAGNSQY
ncbi:mycofactocin-coupled SDR family oxidoreductase [Cryptosporangium minutisporangium]|uniref:Mycofactocin-coupled SDR family oxidoreductase n=1 Tax=Cryptosporangium minutisporangium TaxID=113569 RepID=A0ABP6SSQ9_9ACTN